MVSQSAPSLNPQTLNSFYRLISSQNGVGIPAFQEEFDQLFKKHRSQRDLDNYRLSRGIWKKLADEVSPMSRYFRYRNILSGSIRFPLNDAPPDCFYTNTDNTEIGIEVTITNGKARYHAKQELVDKGTARGFIDLPNDAPQQDFKHRMLKPRTMYPTDSALNTIKNDILLSMRKKNRQVFKDMILVMEASLNSLPRQRWRVMETDTELQNTAMSLPFAEVHVIGNAEITAMGFRLK